MKRSTITIVLLGLFLFPLTPGAQESKPDIEATIVFSSGKTLVYKKEIRQLEIILGADGQVTSIHLVLAISAEKDSHAWFNFKNLAGFHYRYYAISGRAKVQVRRLVAYPAQQPKDKKLPPVDPDDYR